MRAVVQRVLCSSVEVENQIIGSIDKGLNILIGISIDDTEEDVKYLRDKILNLRIFEDNNGKLNKSLKDINGDILVISQFTLYGDCRKGRRPSFVKALPGDKAEILYESFVQGCKNEIDLVQTGKFGADMKVSIMNDGPVTLLIDSKKDF
ncbi:D-aminoacyl-tRNA deacylase [Clostridium sp. DL1XJH146]